MNTIGLLEQLLKSGQQMMQDKTGAQGSAAGSAGTGGLGGLGGLGDLLGGAGGTDRSTGAGGLGGLLSGAGGGAMVASVLGMLLGRKGGSGQALTYGGLAALGSLAYKAYTNWQANQAAAPQTEPQTLDRLTSPQQVEEHTLAILKAMIAAAKADGQIDEREDQLINERFKHESGNFAIKQWLDQELQSPLDAASVAAYATDTGMAVEMYLASVLVADEENPQERVYLDELATHLKLNSDLKLALEKEVRQSAAA